MYKRANSFLCKIDSFSCVLDNIQYKSTSVENRVLEYILVLTLEIVFIDAGQALPVCQMQN